VGFANVTVATGDEVAGLNDDALVARLATTRIFAEIDPVTKERIVKALQRNNTVGYFGDGINDSAALHAADIGISVDSAVDVAKSAASVVLLEKNLAVVAEGVRLGRKTFVNTLKYVRVGVSAAFGNVFSMAIADLFLPFLPLLPMQILLLNFMTDFPAVMISGDNVDDEAISSPRRWDVGSIRTMMIIFGLISTVFDLITFGVLRLGFHASPALFRSGWFVESALTELVVMLILRTNRRFWRSKPGKGLGWSSLLLAGAVIALPYLPFSHWIGFTPIPPLILVFLLGLIVIYAAINEVAKSRWWR
jgi:P-type Mg2+ transporter